MKKILSFGELLLRISADSDGHWLQDNKLPVFPGGAELNVARALGLWKLPVRYLTVLPDNFLSHQIVRFLESEGLDLQDVIYQGDRQGLYYLLQGTDLKHSAVVYDRKNSSFFNLKPGAVDWDRVLSNVSWLHLSAISPALNLSLAEVCHEAAAAAAEKGLMVSFDLNYRPKLWEDARVSPLDTIPRIAAHANLIMGNIWSANKLLGIPLREEILQESEKESFLRHAELSSEEILNRCHRCSTVANTFRFEEERGIRYFAALHHAGRLYQSQEYRSSEIKDKVGSGDCFMAGLIYGIHQEYPWQQLLEFATAAAFGKLFIPGDATTMTVQEITETIRPYAY